MPKLPVSRRPSCSATIETLRRTKGRTSVATKPSARTISITFQLPASETEPGQRADRGRAPRHRSVWHSATLSANGIRSRGCRHVYGRLVRARRRRRRSLAGSSSFIVAAARSIAAALIYSHGRKRWSRPIRRAARSPNACHSRRSSAALVEAERLAGDIGGRARHHRPWRAAARQPLRLVRVERPSR